MSPTAPPPIQSTNAGPSSDGPGRDAPVRRLSRLTDQGRWAGVAAGIGWYLGVDPVLVRIAFVVGGLATGPVAVAAYIACWVLMPARQSTQLAATPPPPSDGRTRGLTAIGIVIALAMMGALSWGSGQVILAAGFIGLGVLLYQGAGPRGTAGTTSGTTPGTQPGMHPGTTPPWGCGPWESWRRSTDPGQETRADESRADESRADESRADESRADESDEPAKADSERGPAQTAYGRPYAADFRPPSTDPGDVPVWTSPWAPRNRPERSRLTPVVIALTMIGLGLGSLLSTIGVLDLTASRAVGFVVLMAGVGLTVGTVFGRARSLIVVGMVGTLVLLTTSAAVQIRLPMGGPFGEVTHQPSAVSLLEEPFTIGAGELMVDLTDLDLQGVRAAEARIDAGAAEVLVIVPPEVDVIVEGEISAAGSATLFGERREGSGISLDTRREGAAPGDDTVLTILVDQWVGEFTIETGGPR